MHYAFSSTKFQDNPTYYLEKVKRILDSLFIKLHYSKVLRGYNYHINFLLHLPSKISHKLFPTSRNFFVGRLISVTGVLLSISNSLIRFKNIIQYVPETKTFLTQKFNHNNFVQSEFSGSISNELNKNHLDMGLCALETISNVVLLAYSLKLGKVRDLIVYNALVKQNIIDLFLPGDVIKLYGISSLVLCKNILRLNTFLKLFLQTIEIHFGKKYGKTSRLHLSRFNGFLNTFSLSVSVSILASELFKNSTLIFWNKILLVFFLLHKNLNIKAKKPNLILQITSVANTKILFQITAILKTLESTSLILDKAPSFNYYLQGCGKTLNKNIFNSKAFRDKEIGNLVMINKDLVVLKLRQMVSNDYNDRLFSEIVEHQEINFADSNFKLSFKFKFDTIVLNIGFKYNIYNYWYQPVETIIKNYDFHFTLSHTDHIDSSLKKCYFTAYNKLIRLNNKKIKACRRANKIDFSNSQGISLLQLRSIVSQIKNSFQVIKISSKTRNLLKLFTIFMREKYKSVIK